MKSEQHYFSSNDLACWLCNQLCSAFFSKRSVNRVGSACCHIHLLSSRFPCFILILTRMSFFAYSIAISNQSHTMHSQKPASAASPAHPNAATAAASARGQPQPQQNLPGSAVLVDQGSSGSDGNGNGDGNEMRLLQSMLRGDADPLDAIAQNLHRSITADMLQILLEMVRVRQPSAPSSQTQTSNRASFCSCEVLNLSRSISLNRLVRIRVDNTCIAGISRADCNQGTITQFVRRCFSC